VENLSRLGALRYSLPLPAPAAKQPANLELLARASQRLLYRRSVASGCGAQRR
jgi:hypothetical protein